MLFRPLNASLPGLKPNLLAGFLYLGPSFLDLIPEQESVLLSFLAFFLSFYGTF
jgi:hypothetical protein